MRFSVYSQVTICKYVGEVEAATAEEAIEVAEETEFKTEQGSLCHYCTDKVGDAGDPEFIVEAAS